MTKAVLIDPLRVTEFYRKSWQRNSILLRAMVKSENWGKNLEKRA